MPFGRGYGRRRRAWPRKKTYTNRLSVSGRRMGTREMKWNDTSWNVEPLAAASQFSPNLCVIPQNATESGRVGRRVKIHRIDIRCRLSLPPSIARNNNASMVRIILYVDRQTNGVIASAADILQTNTIYSHYNLNSQGRFRFLYDKVFSLLAQHHWDGTQLTSTSMERFFIIKKKLGVTIDYDDSFATGVLSTQRTNTIQMLLVLENATSTVVHFIAVARTRYTD